MKRSHFSDEQTIGIYTIQPDLIDGKEMAAEMMIVLGPLPQSVVGRPNDHYGITPVLLF
jgi:hypothetical protein